ncbi:MAG: hypothetical protein HY343_12850 [Lentisphaerae bacterium]|nr:hypothetical protein [Lentisphaerota bacterium]
MIKIDLWLRLSAVVQWLLFAFASALAVFLTVKYLDFTKTGQGGAAAALTVWPAPSPPIPAESWSVFSGQATALETTPSAAPSRSGVETLAKRFRLAGTFFAFGGNSQSRKAILDDIQKKEQIMVGEGDRLHDKIEVRSIYPDRIVLRVGDLTEELKLSFTDILAMPPAPAAEKNEGTVNAEDAGRFGKKVAAHQWVLQRSTLLSYYRELLDNPERLTQVYASLKPLYNGQKISGYTLGVEGEADTFASLGLKEGDVIRMVNSMPMTSQRRAEYFLREFVDDRVNAFVLDIERDKAPTKLIYLIR